jgi:hypothetical protein
MIGRVSGIVLISAFANPAAPIVRSFWSSAIYIQGKMGSQSNRRGSGCFVPAPRESGYCNTNSQFMRHELRMRRLHKLRSSPNGNPKWILTSLAAFPTGHVRPSAGDSVNLSERSIGCPTLGVAQRAMRDAVPHARGANKATLRRLAVVKTR